MVKVVGVTIRKEGWINQVGRITRVTKTKAWVQRSDGETRDFSAVGQVLAKVEPPLAATGAATETPAGSSSASSGSAAGHNVLQMLVQQDQEKMKAAAADRDLIFGGMNINQDDADAFG